MIRKQKIIFIAIIILAAVLRLYRLGEYPALNADEASIGYDAYSLIQTGKDQHGNPWPIHFQSFNDFKPGLVVYLVLPFVKLFGLSAWSIRLPGALFGIACVYMIYLLVKLLFGERKEFSFFNFHFSIGEIAAFLLAISPWHLHFSRGIWEVNISTFFILLGIYSFVKWITSNSHPELDSGSKSSEIPKPQYNSTRGKQVRNDNGVEGSTFSLKYLVFSVTSFALSLYTYHSARVVVPLLLLGALFIYKKEVKENFRNILIAGVMGLILVLPLGYDLTKGAVFSRAAGVGLFADKGSIERINEQRGEHASFDSLSSKALHNKVVNYGLEFLKNYSEHYHGLFLFVSGEEIERNRVPETGQMYLFDILFVLVGLYYILRTHSLHSKPHSLATSPHSLILFWLIVAPIAAGLTFQSPHALRAQNMIIPLVIISALGLVKLLNVIRETRYEIRIAFYVLLIAMVFWNFTRYEHLYWTHMSKEYPFSSQYGLQELVGYVNQEQSKYERVLVTDKYDQPYIMFLFFLMYSPSDFQKDHTLSVPDQYGFSTVRSFGKYEFRGINWDEDELIYPNSLIVGTPEEISNSTDVVRSIFGSNGYEYFKVVAN